MNVVLEAVILICAIFGTYITLTTGMYRRFAMQPLVLSYQKGRMQLLAIFVIGALVALVGNIFKSPLSDENRWLVAKDAILITLAIHLIILLVNGFLADIYRKSIPSNLLHGATVITGIVCVAAASIISQGNPYYLRIGASIGSISFIFLTALFFAFLMTGIIIRIAKR